MTFLRWLAQPVILARLIAEAAAVLLLVYLAANDLPWSVLRELARWLG